MHSPGRVIPTVTFVLGKGGVGRSTIAAAIGSGLASAGERVLVAQWAIADSISPWFGRPRAGYAAGELAPGLWTSNFATDAALEQYFVEHLGMRALFRAVISNRHVRRATRAAPGFDELMFLGFLTYLATTAERELGWRYDHVIVDAPAMGHGASLFAIPQVTAALGLGGLLASECDRVAQLLANPRRVGAIVVTTAEELAIDETREFWPIITRELGRPPLAAIVNRSARALAALPVDPHACAWYAALELPRDASARSGLDRVYAHLERRSGRERALVDSLPAPPTFGTFAVDDGLLVAAAATPREVVARAALELAPLWRSR